MSIEERNRIAVLEQFDIARRLHRDRARILQVKILFEQIVVHNSPHFSASPQSLGLSCARVEVFLH